MLLFSFSSSYIICISHSSCKSNDHCYNRDKNIRAITDKLLKHKLFDFYEFKGMFLKVILEMNFVLKNEALVPKSPALPCGFVKR